MTNHEKYILFVLVLMSSITLRGLSTYYGLIGQTHASYDCMNAYNLQYQLDELADRKHNAQMMLLMPELTGMERATLKVKIRKLDKEMNRLVPLFENAFSFCK